MKRSFHLFIEFTPRTVWEPWDAQASERAIHIPEMPFSCVHMGCGRRSLLPICGQDRAPYTARRVHVEDHHTLNSLLRSSVGSLTIRVFSVFIADYLDTSLSMKAQQLRPGAHNM